MVGYAAYKLHASHPLHSPAACFIDEDNATEMTAFCCDLMRMSCPVLLISLLFESTIYAEAKGKRLTLSVAHVRM